MTRIFHVSQGGVFLVAGYAYYWVSIEHHWPIVVGILASTVASVAIGLLIYYLVYRRMLNSNREFFSLFIGSFGVLVVIQNVISIMFGVAPVPFPPSLLDGVHVDGVQVTYGDMVGVASAVVLTVLMAGFLRYTVTGTRLRSLSDNPELVRDYGLSINKYRLLAYTLGTILVVPGAVIYAYTQGLSPAAGPEIVTIAIVACIAGGVGSLVGSGMVALGYGLISGIAVYWFPGAWADAIAFVAFFILLLVRPDGLFESAT
jgi:branched-subunit amino acid ABC-type transport system permease component